MGERVAWLWMGVVALVISAVFNTIIKASESGRMPSQSESNRIILIRHAQSLGNITQSYSTHPDNPSYYPAHLTATGRAQAQALGSEFFEVGLDKETIAFIISSPLPRAIQTAQIVAQQVNIASDHILLDERLIERNLGSRDGLPYQNFTGDHWYPDTPESFGGETSDQVRERMVRVWKEAVSLAERGHVLLVSHGQPIHSLTELLTGNGQRIGNARYVELYRDGRMINAD